MIESEWQTCADPESMLAFLDGSASDRKLRLFACACCRRVWHLITEPHCRGAVEVAERFADGLGTPEELQEALELSVKHGPVFGDTHRAAMFAAAPKSLDAAVECSVQAAEFLSHKLGEAARSNAYAAVCAGARKADQDEAWARFSTVIKDAFTSERTKQSDLLREILPWPPEAGLAQPEWPATVVQLAEALYAGEDCSFALHDALLESGHSDLAEHFNESAHPKGCWALDRILGRA